MLRSIPTVARAFLKNALWLSGVTIPPFKPIDQLSRNFVVCSSVVWAFRLLIPNTPANNSRDFFIIV